MVGTEGYINCNYSLFIFTIWLRNIVLFSSSLKLSKSPANPFLSPPNGLKKKIILPDIYFDYPVHPLNDVPEVHQNTREAGARSRRIRHNW